MRRVDGYYAETMTEVNIAVGSEVETEGTGTASTPWLGQPIHARGIGSQKPKGREKASSDRSLMQVYIQQKQSRVSQTIPSHPKKPTEKWKQDIE